jgi:hypothetical protein
LIVTSDSELARLAPPATATPFVLAPPRELVGLDLDVPGGVDHAAADVRLHLVTVLSESLMPTPKMIPPVVATLEATAESADEAMIDTSVAMRPPVPLFTSPSMGLDGASWSRRS